MKTKSRKADLEEKKFLFFQVGLIVALSLVLVAFEWTTTGDFNFKIPIKQGTEAPPDDMIITHIDDIIPPPPPPVIVVAELINIHPDNATIPDHDPDIFIDIEVDRLPDLFTPKQEVEVDEVIPFLQIEEQPSFMGGDYNTFSKWVSSQIEYPRIPLENGIQGRVLIQFLIDYDGSVTNITVLRGVDPLLDAEAVRVVSQSPKWTPGKQRKKPARVIFTFPVIFRLSH